MKDEMGSVAIVEPSSIKPKMYSILVSESSEYKKATYVNKNIDTKIGHNGHKNVSLNKKIVQTFNE